MSAAVDFVVDRPYRAKSSTDDKSLRVLIYRMRAGGPVTIDIERPSAQATLPAIAAMASVSQGGVLNHIARLAIAAPRRMLAIAALVAVAAGIFGVPVAKSLCACGFEDPSSESAAAQELLTDTFDEGDVRMVVTVSSPDGADSGAGR